ncbi:MAG: methyltransferase domain-containing protein [Proteobacteria bacterium]|nr:methyltransferase domain-containing protein [Pseudomonadota bacterium]
MKKILLEMLICPACLPEENRLNSNILQAQGEDIVEGFLTCLQCEKVYPIRGGIAMLDPMPLQEKEKIDSRYETPALLAAYLWSHYCDILNDPNASAAYSQWADLVHHNSGFTIDAGSAVGRFTFEMSQKSEFAVGIDNSLSFIQSARALMLKRRIKISLPREGNLCSDVVIQLPEKWVSDKVEFIVGDAQALPFRSKTFSLLASLNLVDKVPLPIKHLKEMNRVAKAKDAQFLFSDPFSWSTDVAKEKDWLGGTDAGPYSGAGKNNIIALLKGEKDNLAPAWSIAKHGHIWWKIRTHANHFELIRSCFVKADR